MPATPEYWFLQFNAAAGDGRPWADGTEMARRAATDDVPWDKGCRVTTYHSGSGAMSAMRDELETVIANASTSPLPVGQRGHVYIAGWRFNCLRDLSHGNVWGTDPWDAGNQQANLDQTAIGLVVRLLQAGVMVRIMVWLPRTIQEAAIDASHAQDHLLAARIVQFESERIAHGQNPPLGVVALDVRTAEKTAASHHQKMMVIRSGPTNVAFVGGVDLAYTRRSEPSLTSGDWQSARSIPDPRYWWPQQAPAVDYTFQNHVPRLNLRQSPDLPLNVYGDSSGGQVRQLWHDQHLMLEGPIVATIEHQFAERWADQAGALYDLTQSGTWSDNQVIFSTARAYNAGQILPLPQVTAIQPNPYTSSRVQMWRTIPLRSARTAQAPWFKRGEFTVMAGIAHAVAQARELIWMFDQYFWSLPLARLLNARLQAHPGLHVIVVLPPHADASPGEAHYARKVALQALTDGVQDRVAIYNMWYERLSGIGADLNRGIYVHAKSHTYDGSLLVCGSANLNRRSFLCDTELACAVLDPRVVRGHQENLLALLFPDEQLRNYDLDGNGEGAQFFADFQRAVRAAQEKGRSLLIRDPWDKKPAELPNGVVRDESPIMYSATYDTFIDPSSVDLKIEKQAAHGQLDEIVTLLENTPGAGGNWPWRVTS